MKDRYALDLWNQVKFNFFFVLGLIISLLLLRMFTGVGFVGALVFVLAAFSFRLFLFGERKPLVFFKTWGIITALFLAVFLLTSFLGWLGVILVLLAFLVYKLWRGWSLFMRSTRHIEKILFGKPLDKSEFKEGEKPSIYEYEEEKKK